MDATRRLRRQHERFWSRVLKDAPDKCWLWLGTYWKARGYGRFCNGWAHRFAWIDANGQDPPPDKPLILHSCDNGRCVNPAHLRPGSHAENMGDRTTRRRTARGECVGSSKLTETQVLEIRRRRADGEKLEALASTFGVAVSTIHGIVHGRRWAHLSLNPQTP